MSWGKGSHENEVLCVSTHKQFLSIDNVIYDVALDNARINIYASDPKLVESNNEQYEAIVEDYAVPIHQQVCSLTDYFIDD